MMSTQLDDTIIELVLSDFSRRFEFFHNIVDDLYKILLLFLLVLLQFGFSVLAILSSPCRSFNVDSSALQICLVKLEKGKEKFGVAIEDFHKRHASRQFGLFVRQHAYLESLFGDFVMTVSKLRLDVLHQLVTCRFKRQLTHKGNQGILSMRLGVFVLVLFV